MKHDRTPSLTPESSNPPDSPEDAVAAPLRPTARRVIVQGLGFAVGIALLVWMLTQGWRDVEGRTPWDHFREAEWWMIALLLGCTAVSLTANAASFAIAFGLFRKVGFWNMQRLNVVANALNYLPLRPGTIVRIVYHLRIDRLGVLTVGAVFAAIAFLMLLAAAALGGASLLRPQVDLIWLLMVATLLVSGGVFLLIAARLPLIVRHGRGFDRLLRHHRMIWPLLALRLIDIAAYTGRVAAAMMIVGIPIESFGFIIMLGVTALLFGLFPVRLGFREAGLAFVAAHFGQPEIGDALWNQLALIESAGEALLYIPLGVCLLPWLRRRWVQSRDSASGVDGVASPEFAGDSARAETAPAAHLQREGKNDSNE